jgi:glutathione S-transferase
MTTSAENKVRLYEVVLGDGRSASPFVWRIRYALAHKGIAFETVKLGFTEIPGVFGGRFKTVPILEHGDTVLAESWDIAEYLDRTFPDHPPLFEGDRG